MKKVQTATLTILTGLCLLGYSASAALSPHEDATSSERGAEYQHLDFLDINRIETASVCYFLYGPEVKGMKNLCHYDCDGRIVTIALGPFDGCPATIRRR